MIFARLRPDVADQGGAAGPFRPRSDNEGRFSALAGALRLVEGAAHFYAICNSNALRDRLLAQLREALPGRPLRVVRLGQVENLYRHLELQLRDTPLEPPEVLCLIGLEAWIPAGDEGLRIDLIRNLNITRDLFPRLIPNPIIFWIPEHILDLIMTAAPDFFSVRSGVYFFAEDPSEATRFEWFAKSLQTGEFSGLSHAEKLQRLLELRHLLEEYGRLSVPDQDNIALMRLRSNLVTVLMDLHQVSEAEGVLRSLLDETGSTMGQQHPDFATCLNNLALILKETNRLAEAEQLARRALAIDVGAFGSDHPHVARDLNNLAQLLKATNRLDQAEPLMNRALSIDEVSHGKEHPRVATRLNNLAQLLMATNRVGEAEPLMRRALAIDEAFYGSGHPEVARDLNNLALLLIATNRLDEAEPLMRRALAIDESAYGNVHHPKLAIRLGNLAELLQAKNRLAEAEPLMREALAIDEASYGKDHPAVARDLNNLGHLLKATKRLGEAEPMMRRMLQIFLAFSRSTGHPHPHLEAAKHNYAQLLAELGKSPEEAQAAVDALIEESDSSSG